MITNNLSTLKIHKLTQEQYDRELEAGRIDPSAIYLTPDDNATVGCGATPDWNENDHNSSSYIKNRPFYAEYFEGNMPLVDKQSVSIGEDVKYKELSSNMNTSFIVGNTYIVTFNGVEYECVAWKSNSDSDSCIIGNGNIYGGAGMGGNEPFSCDSYDNGDVYLNVSTAGIYTISISGNGSGEYIHKIDAKYLPEELMRTTECDQKINDHNSSTTAHSDIRGLVDNVKTLVENNMSNIKTLDEHFEEEMMVLTSLQYGDKLPGEDGEPYTHVRGRIFFRKVSS